MPSRNSVMLAFKPRFRISPSSLQIGIAGVKSSFLIQGLGFQDFTSISISVFEEVFDCAIVQEYVASCEILTLVTGKRQIYANFFHSSRIAIIEAVRFFEAMPKQKVYSILPSIVSAGKENIITVQSAIFMKE